MVDSIRRVLLLGDEKKGGSSVLVEKNAAWLRARGLETDVVVDREAPLQDREADVVVVWGGDGSLLSAARRMGDHQRPTLGINRGRLGFLTAFEDEQTELALQMLIGGKLVEETRLMFHCRVEVEGDGDFMATSSTSVLGLNDIVVSRAGAGGMIIVRVRRGEAEIGTFRGDGVIAATATGSTAYSMAAGGPVLAPDLDAIAVTPLASHSLSAHPVALSMGAGLEFEIVETGDMPYAYCIIDGQVQVQVQAGTRVSMTTAPHRFRHLVQSPNQFWDVLVTKFGFAGMARSRG